MASEIAIPDSAVDPSAYVASLLRTLGNQDPVAIYQETFDRVETITRGLSDGQWLLPLTSHEWSPYQIVGHLVDVDIVYGFRLRLALTSDNPTYPGYDERAWADLPKAPPEGRYKLLAIRNKASNPPEGNGLYLYLSPDAGQHWTQLPAGGP